MAKRRQVSIYINGREIGNNIKSIRSEASKLSRELNHMTVGSAEYNATAKELAKVKGIIRDHNRTLRGTSSAYGKMQMGLSKFVGIAAGAFAADQIVQYGAQLFKLGAEMEVLSRKAETVFGEALPQVTRQAEMNANAMGLTVSAYTDAATAIGDLLVPMGFAREEAAGISTNLVNLSGALSEWTGGQIKAEDVTRILSKAMLGEREELKQLGIAISEADVKERLRVKGLQNLTGELLQQAKATATLELVTEKSLDAQTAFAENSDTLVRRQAELSAKLADVSEKLATALLPVFDRLLDLASAGADLLGDFTTAVTNMTDPVQGAANAFDEQARKVSDLQGELNPLLGRYDELTSKSELTKDEQKELGDTIKRIGELTPTAITEVDKYGNALSINASASRDFLEAEKARLEFVNKESIAAIEKQIARAETLRRIEKEKVETGQVQGLILSSDLSAGAIEEARQNLAKYTREIEGAQAQLARLTGSNLGGGGEDDQQRKAAEEAKRLAQEEIKRQQELALQRAAAREKAAEEAQKARERELKAQQAQYDRLLESLEKFQEEVDMQQLTEDEQDEARIRAKYEKQIELARQLEQFKGEEAIRIRMELEALLDEELELLQQQRIEREKEKQIEIGEAFLEGFMEFQERKKAVEEELKLAADEVLLSESELALLQLEENYLAQLELAQQYGIDTTRLTEAYRKEQADINAKYDQQDQQARIKAVQETTKIISGGLQAFGSVISGIIQAVGEESRAGAELSKVLALTNIGINTAEAISNAVVAGSNQPFPANLIAIATGIATVVANMAQASAILNKTSVPQRKDGGFTEVIGQDDGMRYRAKNIGSPGTGFLPNYPVLIDSAGGGQVLGSEAGYEYFVANKDLQNPAVFNYVRAIENIRRARQFAGGGPTDVQAFAADVAAQGNQGNTISRSPGAINESVSMLLLTQLTRLNDLLDRGIYAMYDDDEVVNIANRFGKINEASGGVL
jgi:hypothetical protein